MEHEITVKDDGSVTVKVTRGDKSASASGTDPVEAALKAAEKLLGGEKKRSSKS
jgi:hypothetical protein